MKHLKTIRFWKHNFSENEIFFVFILITAGKQVKVVLTYETIRFWKQNFFFVVILKPAGKRVKIIMNFENEKKSFSKFENVFFLSILEFFEKNLFLGISEFRNGNIKRFKIRKIVLNFFKTIFEKYFLPITRCTLVQSWNLPIQCNKD